MTTALVTLAIGETYLERWRRMCEPAWRAYAGRYGYELIVIEKPIDTTPRAEARSPAWQKCLVLDPEIGGPFERVVWIDADIVINPAAPPITAGVPIEKIGATDEHVFPSAESRQAIIASLVDYWRPRDAKVARNWETFRDPAEWHAFAGLPKRGRHMIQTGVMVMSPKHHRELLQHVYRQYEDTGGEHMNYEMRPLSFEVQEEKLEYLIDGRFNALVSMLILQEQLRLKRPLTAEETTALLTREYQKNYFLHFAGRQELMVGRAGPRSV